MFVTLLASNWRPEPKITTRWFTRLIVRLACLSVLLAGATVLPGATPPDLKALAARQYGSEAVKLITQWEALINDFQSADTATELKAVNDFFNTHIQWVSDQNAYGVEDYWATPLETMGKTLGDCEDFTIAKYTTLLLMGVDPDALRLIYVKAKRSGLTQAHMVLAWYKTPQSTPLILDNLDTRILPANERGDLFPVFSFNGSAIWVGSQNKRTNADPRARLSRWRQVLDRMRREGFSPTF